MNNIKQLIETLLDEVEQSTALLEQTTETQSKLARARLMTITRISQAWLSTFGSAIDEVEESHRNAKIMAQVFPASSQAMRNQAASQPLHPTGDNRGNAYLPNGGKAIHNFI